MDIKNNAALLAGLAASYFAWFIDIFGIAIAGLVALMLIDTVTGILAHTVSGDFNGKKAAKGIIFKLYYLLLLSATFIMGEIVTGLEQAGVGLTIVICVLEFISIADNGYKINPNKMPKRVKVLIELLKEKVGETNENR